MAEEKTPRLKRAPVAAWQTAFAGIDTDPYLRSYRQANRDHESAGVALDFYTRLFLEAPLAIVITTPDFHIADANVAAQKLLNRTLKTLRGKPFQRCISKNDRRAFTEISNNVRKSPFRVTSPFLLARPGSVEMEVSLTACAFRDADGVPELIMMILVERGDDASEDML